MRLLLLLLLLLSDNLPCVELHKHGPICLELLYRDRQSKVVQQKELQFQVVQFD
jgi:hypothetical protein